MDQNCIFHQITIMTRKYCKLYILSALFCIPQFSCDKQPDDGSCVSYAKAPVTKIEGVTTTLANQDVTLTISFGCFNGCGQFGNFEETIVGNITTIKVNAKYEGCVCTQEAPIRVTSYNFKKTQTGTYELKFSRGENSYLTHTIVVQ